MIILKNLNQLTAASVRAAQMKPRLRILDFGLYEVSGSRGNWYSVECKKDGAGNRLVWCSCSEGQVRKANVPCYHMAPAVGAHILLAIARRSVTLEYGT